MGVVYNSSYTRYRTAKELINDKPSYLGKDGYYMLYPNGPNDINARQIVYCDMTTDGGGWMMITRSHPTTINYNGQNWGWLGGKIGDVKDFSQAYQAGWKPYWDAYGVTFSEFVFGNRNNINDNSWGPFIYKKTAFTYSNLINSDTQQSSTTTTLKSNTSVYGSISSPGMQGAIGFANTGTTNNVYYMRDCCGFSATYGAKPTSLTTTYCSSDASPYYSGPWCGGSSTDGNGNFLDGVVVTAGGRTYGGTNQYMIMVR